MSRMSEWHADLMRAEDLRDWLDYRRANQDRRQQQDLIDPQEYAAWAATTEEHNGTL